MAFRSSRGLGGTQHSQDIWEREWETSGKEIPLKQCCCAPPGCCIHTLSPGSAACPFHRDQSIREVQSNWATWSAAFSRNLGTEFDIFRGVYSIRRCKSHWSAMGPTCHTALHSAEIPGGRSGPSVLKNNLWEKRKGSQCQISPFFSHLSGAFILLPWLQIWFLQMPFSVQLPFTPSHIPASCSEPPPDSSISLKETRIKFSPGRLSISSVFNMILLCNFKSGENFWPFPFFLLARIQEYYLSCEAFLCNF